MILMFVRKIYQKLKIYPMRILQKLLRRLPRLQKLREQLPLRVHNFSRLFSFDANKLSGQTVRLRFRVKVDIQQAHETVPDFKIGLYYFDNIRDTDEPVIQSAFDKSIIFAGQDEKDICLLLDVPENAEIITIYSYTAKNNNYSWELNDIEILTQNEHYKVIDVGEDLVANMCCSKLDLSKRWRQEGDRIIVNWLNRDFYVDLPSGFSLENFPDKLLQVVEEILFGKLELLVFDKPRELGHKKYADFAGFGLDKSFKTKKILLSFSAGEDSTAALAILPDETQPYFCYRPYSSYTNARGALCTLTPDINEMKSLDRISNVMKIASTFEKIGLSVGTTHGFRDGFGYAAIGIFLCKHLDANVLSFGSVMEQVYLKSGNNFTDIVYYKSSSFNSYRKLLGSIGIFWCFPTGFLSEVLTNKICGMSKDKYTAVPCPSTDAGGRPCGVCFKCFRKIRLQGDDAPPPSITVKEILTKRPLKSGTSVVYAAQKSNYTNGEFQEHMNTDLGFLTQYFGDGFDNLLPKDIQKSVKEHLRKFEISRMTREDENKLRNVAKVFDPQNYSKARAFPQK